MKKRNYYYVTKFQIWNSSLSIFRDYEVKGMISLKVCYAELQYLLREVGCCPSWMGRIPLAVGVVGLELGVVDFEVGYIGRTPPLVGVVGFEVGVVEFEAFRI